MSKKHKYNVKTLSLISLLAIIVTIATISCQQKQDYSTETILKRFQSFNKSLSKHDQKYALFFKRECKPGSNITIIGAEELFSAFEQWQQKRNDIFTAYSELNFSSANSRIREFKNQQLIDILVTLSSEMNKINQQVKPEFINNAKCNTTSLPSKVEPGNPHMKSKNCTLQCDSLNTVSGKILELSLLQQKAIDKASKKIKNLPY